MVVCSAVVDDQVKLLLCSGPRRSFNDIVNRKAIMMGYGSGAVIGISIGYMVLFTRSVDHWFLKIYGRELRHISIAPLSGQRRR